jgi:hypothetical protein
MANVEESPRRRRLPKIRFLGFEDLRSSESEIASIEIAWISDLGNLCGLIRLGAGHLPR